MLDLDFLPLVCFLSVQGIFLNHGGLGSLSRILYAEQETWTENGHQMKAGVI